jgi:nitric-oxide synthase
LPPKKTPQKAQSNTHAATAVKTASPESGLAGSTAKCPFHASTSGAIPAVEAVSRAVGETIDSELSFLAEAHHGTTLTNRLAACRDALVAGRPAPLTSAELTWAGRIAWRNHARCIGRLYWRTLAVRDLRHLTTAEELATSLAEHLAQAQGNGNVRSLLSVFAPPSRLGGGPALRIWNHQLCAYAGYDGRAGAILGDPKNAALTAQALRLGWKPPVNRTAFDLLPWIISGIDGQPKLFPLAPDLVREVPLRHPNLPWFEKLGLRWYAVPVISDMRLHAAGVDYSAAPFNGWYMSTEIAARNLADVDRYNLLPHIADRLGLDRRRPSTLWQDRALLELNAAVLHSYQAEGVKLVDHHTAADEFMKFCAREKAAGRNVSARWDWIVPPMSPATTPVFHTPMREFPTSPDFHPQLPAWE